MRLLLVEDDVRIAQQFKPLSGEEMAALRQRADGIKGPALEDWKRNVQAQADGTLRSMPGSSHG